ncbi:TetR/AcrR family transcriptional regulator [Actinomadura madurae]|uniref:TetR/AcrR family transcriptional regulator n=1 Tax=Actinomadura madurae TaxID=1993 RepID=UPI0020270E76|nr:TetR/AcrR family transcriptional regulator [Actinomadura madurae]URM95589.1 TetR/AcrR family transcriptional regulator [Actinomadura madurae]
MQRRTRPLGRPAKLSREAIVAAALECDLRTVTMRDLAARLGVSHAALYRWVADRAELFDLISEVMVERVLPTSEPTPETWRGWLSDLAWMMHDEFLAVPGYAAHVAAPHRHNPEAFARLHGSVVRAFTVAGASPEMAQQSWFVFGLGVVQWLGAQQTGHDLGPDKPRFDLFLDVLLRGLPAQDPSN